TGNGTRFFKRGAANSICDHVTKIYDILLKHDKTLQLCYLCGQQCLLDGNGTNKAGNPGRPIISGCDGPTIQRISLDMPHPLRGVLLRSGGFICVTGAGAAMNAWVSPFVEIYGTFSLYLSSINRNLLICQNHYFAVLAQGSDCSQSSICTPDKVYLISDMDDNLAWWHWYISREYSSTWTDHTLFAPVYETGKRDVCQPLSPRTKKVVFETKIVIKNFSKAITYTRAKIDSSVFKSVQMSSIFSRRGVVALFFCSREMDINQEKQGEYQKAIDYYKKGLEISTAIGDRLGESSSNGNLGNAYLRLGQYQKAIDYYKKGLEISTAIGDRSRIANNNGNLGNAYLSLGEYQKAIDYYKNGLEISTAIGNRSGIASKKCNLGNAYLSLGEYQKAIDYYKEGLEISTAIGDRSEIARSNCNLGNAYVSLGEYQKAIDYYKEGEYHKAIDYYKKGEYQKAIDYYKKGLEISTAIGRRSRIASNLSNLGNAHRCLGEIFLDFVPDQNKLSFTKQYFISHTSLMSCFLSFERIEAALLVIDLGMFDYALFAFDLKDSLNVWVLNGEVIFRKLDACLETLECLIMELLGRLKVGVDRNSSFCKPDPVFDTHNQMIFPFEIRKQKPPLSKNALQNTACYGHLIDPVKNLVNGNRLVVVPDPQLFFTPFSALIDENGSFLSNSYSVQITPSLHTLICTMEQSCDSNFGFALFVGNPTVGKVSLNGEDFTPCGLPSAAEEVKCLSKLFQATPLLGRAATKEVVLQLLNGASIIHIAAHGEPNRGEIMLAPNSSRVQPCLTVPTPESYLLTQRDILNMSVQARLVVLCCCHTGQGEITSEGVIGITRAFLAAGARCVLATLWPIDDNATKEFMEKFYDELCQETSASSEFRRKIL
ncbi:tetratricopeptide repeat 28-like, partial [Paramuricea clavata]